MNTQEPTKNRRHWIKLSSGYTISVHATDMHEAYQIVQERMAPEEGFGGPMHREEDEDHSGL